MREFAHLRETHPHDHLLPWSDHDFRCQAEKRLVVVVGERVLRIPP